jgi:hypothetical protein
MKVRTGLACAGFLRRPESAYVHPLAGFEEFGGAFFQEAQLRSARPAMGLRFNVRCF